MAELGEQGAAHGAPGTGAPPSSGPPGSQGPGLDRLGARWPRAESQPPEWVDGDPLGRPPHPPRLPRPHWRRPRWRRPTLSFQTLVVGFGLAMAAFVLVVVTLVPESRGVISDGPASRDERTREPVAPEPPSPPVPDGVAVGGELVDTAAFAAGPATHFAPARAATQADVQVLSALYDGLTDIPALAGEGSAVPRPAVAESWEVSEDGLLWTFHIRRGLTFADGTPVLPSSFATAWHLASAPGTGSPYAYLFRSIEGGAEKLAGEIESLPGVVALDGSMVLEVRLAEPFADFDAIVSHPVFSPVGTATTDERAVGNGPFVQADEQPADGSVVLVPNAAWDGTRYDDVLARPARPFLDRLVLQAGDTPDADVRPAAMTPLPAGRPIPSRPTLAGTYVLSFDNEDPQLGQPRGANLRHAIDRAVDRERVARVFGGARMPASVVTPPAISGFAEEECRCGYDPDAARAAIARWREMNPGTGPVRITLGDAPTDVAVGAILVENLGAVGLEAEVENLPPAEYAAALQAGRCQVCWEHRMADVPTYDNLLGELVRSNYGIRDGFDGFGTYTPSAVVRELARAAKEPDRDDRATIYRKAEQLTRSDSALVPVLWDTGELAWGESVGAVPVQPTGIVAWEHVALRA
jgi:oligopeptide transport system substrate-binding protein